MKAVPGRPELVSNTPDPLTGHVYLAAQGDNPFGSLFALYIVVRNEQRGLLVKLAGEVSPDPVTGQLTTTFDDNPQLPFSKLTVRLKDGPLAPLVNPPDCGTHTATAELSSWAAQDDPVVEESSFEIDCPGRQGFTPAFEAGSVNPVGGAFSPFIARIDRPTASSCWPAWRSICRRG